MISSYYSLLALRVATFTQNLCLNSYVSLFESGLYTSEQIINESQLRPIMTWYGTHIYSNNLPDYNYFQKTVYGSLDYNSSIFLVELLHINYIILLKNFSFYYYFSSFYFSSFISNISYPVIFETEHYNGHYTK